MLKKITTVYTDILIACMYYLCLIILEEYVILRLVNRLGYRGFVRPWHTAISIGWQFSHVTWQIRSGMRRYVLFIPLLYILECYFAHVCVHFSFVISVNIPLIIWQNKYVRFVNMCFFIDTPLLLLYVVCYFNVAVTAVKLMRHLCVKRQFSNCLRFCLQILL